MNKLGTPIRIQRRRTKGWKLPPNTVCVTRGSEFGNPFPMLEDTPAERATVVDLYRRMVMAPAQELKRAIIRHELRGKNLACFCLLDQPCHADILLEIANA